MIIKLESAGLGFFVKATHTQQKLGMYIQYCSLYMYIIILVVVVVSVLSIQAYLEGGFMFCIVDRLLLLLFDRYNPTETVSL